jgi:hypothetical protein
MTDSERGRRGRAALVALAVGSTASCDLPLPSSVGCTEEVRPGIRVEVRDSVTGEPAAAGARLIARDGAYADTSDQLPAPYTDPLSLRAADERAGWYDVSVEKTGYRDWRRRPIRVTKDRCHVRTVQLRVRLQPEP